MTEQKATYQQLREIIEDSDSLISELELTNANLYIPTDGKGLRICVSGPKGQCSPGTKMLTRKLKDGETVAVQIEIHDDFRPVKPLDGGS